MVYYHSSQKWIIQLRIIHRNDPTQMEYETENLNELLLKYSLAGREVHNI